MAVASAQPACVPRESSCQLLGFAGRRAEGRSSDRARGTQHSWVCPVSPAELLSLLCNWDRKQKLLFWELKGSTTMGQLDLPEPSSSNGTFESHITNFPSRAESGLLVTLGDDLGQPELSTDNTGSAWLHFLKADTHC